MPDKLPPKILVIESNDISNATLCNTIERYWFNVIRTKNAADGVRLAEIDPPNVAIISSKDQKDSINTLVSQLRKIKELHDLPIIFLIEQDESKKDYYLHEDRHVDFVVRPFTPNQLMISIRSLLRKSKPVFQDKILKHNDICMDLSTYKIHRKNKKIGLGPTEFKILQLLIKNPKNIFSRRQIIDYAWGVDKQIAPRTIDVHINRIRNLLKLDTDKNPLIKTIRALGYCLN